MADVQDIYRGIIKPGPQGGVFAPGPPVMLPPQQMVSRSDSVGPGSDWGSLTGMRDDPIYGGNNGPVVTADHIPGPSSPFKSTDRLMPSDAGNAFAYGDGIQPQAPGLDAISAALNVPLPRSRPTPPSNLMAWEPVHHNTAPAPADPWGRLRADGGGAVTARPGMVTGNVMIPAQRSAAPRQQQVMIAPAQAPGQRFLEDRGVSTQGLTIGQQANELNKALAGGSRNEDGSRSFM